MSGVVTWITYAPVKGLGLLAADEVELEASGVRGNRRFHLIGEDGRLVNGKFAGQLVQIRPDADPDGRSLALMLPDGSTVAGEVETGEAVVTEFYGRPVGGHLVVGEFAEAISSFAGRPSLWLDDLYVDAEVRSLGIGARLLARLGEIAAAHGCTHLGWTASVGNPRGIAFYERAGATIVDRGELRVTFRLATELA